MSISASSTTTSWEPAANADTSAHPDGGKPFATSIGAFVKRRTAALALSGILTAIGSALGLAPFYIVYRIAIELFVAAKTDVPLLVTLAALAVVIAIVRGIVMTAATHISHIAAYDILYEARIELARKLGTLPLGFFSDRNTGDLKRVIHEDVEQMEEGIAHMIPDAVGGFVTPLLALIGLAFVDWRMTLAMVATIVLALAVFAVLNRTVSGEMKHYGELVAVMNAAVIQYINGMRVIKAFTLTEQSFEKLRESIDTMSDFYKKVQAIIGGGFALVFMLIRGALLTVLPAGVYFWLNGSLSTSALILFLIMAVGFNRPLMQIIIGLSYASFQVQASAGRLAALLAEPSLAEPARPKSPNGTDVEFRAVTFAYKRMHQEPSEAMDALKGVSLRIPQGTVTALVGPSGAGKTTMARLIPRFWDVDNGAVLIGGVDVREIGTERLMSMVSFVFQDVFLFNDTVAANIRIGKPDASDEEVIAAAKAARCHEFVTNELSAGYQTIIGENGSRLSGGQRQRLSIARAILKDAPIVVLDEATAFVDPESESHIQLALSALIRAGKTVIIVAHRLSTITDVDQIAVVDDGTIHAVGTHTTLLRDNALYQSLWDAHMQAGRWEFSNTAPEHAPASASETAPARPEARSTNSHNPYAALSETDSLPRAVYKLSVGARELLWRGVVAKLIEGALVAAPTLMMFLVLTQILSPEPNSAKIWLFTAVAVLMFIGQYIFHRIGLGALLKMDTAMQRNLRVFLADHMRRLPLGFFTKRDVGTIDALFTTHLQFLETRLAIDLLLIAVVTPLLVFLQVLFVDWRMALAMLAGAPVAIIAIGIVNRTFLNVWRLQSDARTRANARIVEYIQGIPVLRAFNLTGARHSAFDRALNDYRIASRHTTTKLSPATAGYATAVEASFAVVILVGALLHARGALDATPFLLSLILATAFYAPLLAMGDYLGVQRIVQNAVRNLNTFLKTRPLPEPDVPKPARGFEIVFDRVTFGYNADIAAGDDSSADTIVLRDVSFTIPERTICALVGPSGSGKTTITNLIARFWDVNSGAVRVGGVDVRDRHIDDLLRDITMVFQDVYLFNDTILNNIKLGKPDASEAEVIAAAKAAQCHEFISALPNGYATVVAEGGASLSGGQKQRISIARALLKDAPIVLLDEATASLDPENEQLIQRAFDALAARKTLVIIAHQLTTIQRADQILVIDGGRIVEQGRHADLLAKRGLYQRFWHERLNAKSWKAHPEVLPAQHAN